MCFAIANSTFKLVKIYMFNQKKSTEHTEIQNFMHSGNLESKKDTLRWINWVNNFGGSCQENLFPLLCTIILQQLNEWSCCDLHQWCTGHTHLALGWCTCVSNRCQAVTGIWVLVFSPRTGDISTSTLELQPLVLRISSHHTSRASATSLLAFSSKPTNKGRGGASSSLLRVTCLGK